MQMDSTKRMYIDQILRKTAFYDDFDFHADVIGQALDEETQQASGNNVITKELLILRKEETRQKLKNSQSEVYFQKLKQSINVKTMPCGDLSLSVSEFPLRIVFVDKILGSC